MKIGDIPTPTGRPHRDIAAGTVVVSAASARNPSAAYLTAKTLDGARFLVNIQTGVVVDNTAADNLDVMGFVSYPEARVVFE